MTQVTKEKGWSLDLRTMLVLRLCLVALVCLLLATVGTLWQSHFQAKYRASETAALVVKQLKIQLSRVNTGFDSFSRFPDLDQLVPHALVHGQCVRFVPRTNTQSYQRCMGSLGLKERYPDWFAYFHKRLVAAVEAVKRDIRFRGNVFGEVIVTTEPPAVLARSWRNFTQIFLLTIFLNLAFCILVYGTVGRALAPAGLLVSGLERLAKGDFSHRLPAFKLMEFHRIRNASNVLAGTIEQTLAERSELMNKLVSAQETERRSVARELHDEFGQNLTAINALSASIATSLRKDCPDALHEIQLLSQIAENMAESLRGTLLRLSPADLDKVGLAESLKQLVALWNVAYVNKTKFEFRGAVDIPAVSANRAVQLYRIAQEGLTNAAQHAEAENVCLKISSVREGEGVVHGQAGNSAIELLVEDNGKGGQKQFEASVTKGRGLLNMSERVKSLGGSIEFESLSEIGFKMLVQIPAEEPRR